MSGFILFGVTKDEVLAIGAEPDDIVEEWESDKDIVNYFATHGFPQATIIASSALVPKIGLCFMAQGNGDHGGLIEYANAKVRRLY